MRTIVALALGTTIVLAGCSSKSALIPHAPSSQFPAAQSVRPSAGSYTVVYRFGGGSDGIGPAAALKVYKGKLYGTTFGGGTGNGTIFSLAASGAVFKDQILHAFASGSDGANPQAPLIALNGVLYGTTTAGGANTGCGYYTYPPSPYVSCGTAFKLVLSTKKEYVINAFKTIGGWRPLSGLLPYNGTLVGTTEFIGRDNQCFVASSATSGCGLVYSLTGSGTVYKAAILHSFDPASAGDGANPAGNLVVGPKGTIIGTTLAGGSSSACNVTSSASTGCGTVYELVPTGGGFSERVMVNFAINRIAGGANPSSGLTAAGGAYFGTTYAGGNARCTSGGFVPGCGVVYRLRPSGGRLNLSVVHTFAGGSKGAVPSGGVIAVRGTLYGTTLFGGSTAGVCSNLGSVPGCGVVYKLTPSGTGYVLTILHAFTGGSDGAQPAAGLTLWNGRLYGTTFYGGNTACKNGCGTVFAVSP
jgi:uncharacterized repeat protein (TIGR03803 family)